MQRVRKFLITLLLFLGWLTQSISASNAEQANSIQLTGSKYVYFTVSDLAKVYMDHTPGNNIVVQDSDQGSGIQALLNKSCDAIMVMGKLDDDVKEEALEKGIGLQEHVIGWGAVVLVTHPTNPVNELTMTQVKQIFAGEIENWKQVGGLDEPITILSRDEAVSGTERLLREMALQGFPFSQKAIRLFDYDIVRPVWKSKGAIADARFTEAVRGRIKGMVKILSIKEDDDSTAVAPSGETMLNRSYPLAAPLVIYYDSKSPKSSLRQFVDFCARRGLGTRFSEMK
jgi:phosphate transport system substrate-binding protein